MNGGGGDELVRSATLYTRRPRLLHGTVLPFLALLYPAWLYAWLGLYSGSWGFWSGDPQDQDQQEGQDPQHPPTEAGLLALAAVVIAHILTALSGYWSVHAHCWLTCSKVNMFGTHVSNTCYYRHMLL